MGNSKKIEDIKKKINKAENQVKYYNDLNMYFTELRPKGIDTIKAEESLSDLRTQLQLLENEEY
jgi:hypothetical protein